MVSDDKAADLYAMPAFPDGDHAEASELPPAPEGVNAQIWRAFGIMFDVKLIPMTRTLNSLNLAMVEWQKHAVHRATHAITHSNVQTIADSVTVLYQTHAQHDEEIRKLQ